MTYATQQDLIDRFGARELIELTDRADPPEGEIDAAVVAKALADADALVNGYAGKRYAVPLAPVPPLVVQIAGDVARYLLHGDAPTEIVKERYKQSERQLRDIADGRLVLEVAGAVVRQSSLPETAGPDRTFSRGTMRRF